MRLNSKEVNWMNIVKKSINNCQYAPDITPVKSKLSFDAK